MREGTLAIEMEVDGLCVGTAPEMLPLEEVLERLGQAVGARPASPTTTLVTRGGTVMRPVV